MGYSHTWSKPKNSPAKKFAHAMRDAWTVWEYLHKATGLELAEHHDGSPLSVYWPKKNEISFNGVGGSRHEDFIVRRDNDGDGFCKTDRKPYDLMVCAALIILRHHLGEKFRVSSDGENDEENWPKARELCQRVLGYGNDFWLPPHGVKVTSRQGVECELWNSTEDGHWSHADYRLPMGLRLTWARQRERNARWVVSDDRNTKTLFVARTMHLARWWATCHSLLKTLPEEARTSTVVALLESAKSEPGNWHTIWLAADAIEDVDSGAARAFRYRLPARTDPRVNR